MNNIVCISGLEGSGTRIIAEMVKNSGCYLGNNNNYALDNLIFANLFNHPSLLREDKYSKLKQFLQIFEKNMVGQPLTAKELRMYYNQTFKHIFYQKNFSNIHNEKIKQYYASRFGINSHAEEFKTQNIHAIKQLINYSVNSLKIKRNTKHDFWGWKVGFAFLFIETLSKYFPDLKYIHVIRHGLDMAFSRKVKQLYMYGKYYNVEFPGNNELLPKAQLQYWINANSDTINKGTKLLGNNFYVLNYDNLCSNSNKEITSLMDFLNKKTSATKLDELSKIPNPVSTGRYKNIDLNIFDNNQLSEVKRLGFSL